MKRKYEKKKKKENTRTRENKYILQCGHRHKHIYKLLHIIPLTHSEKNKNYNDHINIFVKKYCLLLYNKKYCPKK